MNLNRKGVSVSGLAVIRGGDYFTAGVAAAPASCASLASLNLPNTTIDVAGWFPPEPFLPPGSTLPIDTAACRVAGTIKPTSDSDIKFEVWMPATDLEREIPIGG